MGKILTLLVDRLFILILLLTIYEFLTSSGEFHLPLIKTNKEIYLLVAVNMYHFKSDHMRAAWYLLRKGHSLDGEKISSIKAMEFMDIKLKLEDSVMILLYKFSLYSRRNGSPKRPFSKSPITQLMSVDSRAENR